MINKKVCLLILDGLGEKELNVANPLRFIKGTNFNFLKKNFPFGLLAASGISVGLYHNMPGSCENGYLTMGTGEVYFENFPRINLSIERGDFFKNPNLINVFNHCHNFNSRLHLVGLISDSYSKSSLSHLYAILEAAKTNNVKNIFLHLFTDGFEAPPKSALSLLRNMQRYLLDKKYNCQLASLCGRYYALDESGDYALRTQRAFLLIVAGNGFFVDDPFIFLEQKYQDPNFSDALLEPIMLNKDGYVKDNDAVLFFHFENKAIFQLANAFLNPDFQFFNRPGRNNLYIASLTKYLENIDYPVIFEEQKITSNLSKILAEHKLSQIKFADESKDMILRYYFNGFIEEEHSGEVFKIFPDLSQAKNLEELISRSKEILDSMVLSIKEGNFDFILTSISTLDIIGHSGNFRWAINFLNFLDEYLGYIYEILQRSSYILIITSDHGNIEKMIDLSTGEKNTLHTDNPVPFYYLDLQRKKEKSKIELSFYSKKILGSLVDIAPTILDIFNIQQPPSFTGRSLLKFF